MPKHQNLIYALKEGQSTSVTDVESGLKCGCICPACGEPLVAKKGGKVVHHFAHYAGKNCEYGYQSSLHLAAKEILARAKKMVIPAVEINFPGTYKREVVSEEKEISIDRVELEQHFGDVIPDIVVYSGGKYFFVEIFVTHRVDGFKIGKLRSANVSTIEIDLSKINRTISSEELQKILLWRNESKEWIYNATANQWMNRFKEISDKKKILFQRGFQQVYHCPLKTQNYYEYMHYASVTEECFFCSYCVAQYGGYILCSGKKKIKNIQDLIACREESRKEHKCPLCGAAMVQRNGKYGPFWGCSRYPACEGTKSI